MTREERWRQVEAVLQAALDIESGAGARARFVAEACGGDESLRAEVERLLAAGDEASSFIESPAWLDDGLLDSALRRDIEESLAGLRGGSGEADSGDFDKDAGDFTGTKVGAFELKKEIGRGGMGAVYLAERVEGGFRQKAAVKLVRRGVDTDFVVRRFRHERQILAALEHPYVARLIDGGATPNGLPYFVMEYVEGEPLYAYCGRRKLNLAERLGLFLLVCEAVESAHEAGVVHRDLKPSNILIKTNGKPKLLDFGIAKLLDADLASETVEPTATGMRLMTPEYASPEQVRGEKVSTASDIYSLGVLLYELAAGRRPYKFKTRSIPEIQRAVCEARIEPPSAGAGPEIENLKYVSEINEFYPPRQTEALDRIVLKTLRKNAGERYQTVTALTEDLRRWLERRPVLAESFAAAVPPPNVLLSGRETGHTIRPARRSFLPAEIQKAAGGREKTVAVLPLKFLRGAASGAGDDFLGIGLTDALVMKLSNVRRFVVRPTSSVLRYHEKTSVDPFAAGRELGVEFLVDGNIRQSGEKIRVNIQLLNVAENSTVWARAFDERYTDVLELEDAISARVAESLVPHLSGEERHNLEKRGTNKPAAHEAYLRGRHQWHRMTAEGFAKSIEFYQGAIRLDDSFAAAYAGTSEYYSWMAVYGLLPPKESLAKAREAAEKAVALDDTLAEAHAAHGLALLTHETQWALAEKRFRRAIELNQNSAQARVLYACQLAMEGRFGESIAEARRARALDPLNPFNRYILAWCLYQARDYDESIAEHLSLVKDEPHYGSGYFTLSWCLRRAGRAAEAVSAAQRARELGGPIPMISAALAAAYAETGEAEKALKILAELDGLSARQYVTPLHRALVRLHLGETASALGLLEEAVAENDPWTVWLGTEPQLDFLRDDARFQALLRRAKNPFAGK